MTLVLILCLVILGIIIYNYFKNYHFKLDGINFFQAQLGGGKSYTLTWCALKCQRRRIFTNKLKSIWNKCMPKKINFTILPIDIYSNYPIWCGKKIGWSKAINKDIWWWKYKLPENCIIVYDELANDLPNVKGGKAVMSDDRLKFCLRWFRHGTNATIFACSQSLSEVDKTFRAKVQHVYNLSNFKKHLFWNSINVVESFVSEDITTVYSDSDKDHIENIWRSRLKRNRYYSRYGKKLYDLNDKEISFISSNADKIMKLCNLNNGDSWNGYVFDISRNLIQDEMKRIA